MKKWFRRHWYKVLAFVLSLSFLAYAVADVDWVEIHERFPDPPVSDLEELIEEVITDGSS